MTTPVRRAIYGKLAADVTLNALLGTPGAGYAKSIYYQLAPDDAAYPFVVMNKQAGTPMEAMGNPDALDTELWFVKGVDRQPTPDNVEAIQARVKALLNDASLSISGATLTFLRRQSDEEYSELADGTQYKHAGSLFRLVYT